MSDHKKLVDEIPLVQQMTVEQRLFHAKQRRLQQLEKSLEYEEASVKLQKRSDLVKFPDEILLLEATQKNEISEVRKLLDSGIRPDIKNHDGFTAIHQSSIDGTNDILKLLILYGGNVNCIDDDGWTPLHAAVACRRVSIIRTLLDAGADLLILNNEMTFPYDMSDDINMLRLLDKEMYARGITNDILNEIRSRPEKNYLKFLKAGGIDDSTVVLQKIDSSEATHLHFAAAYNFSQVAKYLLTLGAAVNSLDNKLWTPLHVASYFSQQNVAQILLEHDADPILLTENGYNAYDLCNDQEMREWMMKLVVFLNQKDPLQRRSTLPAPCITYVNEWKIARGSLRRLSLRENQKSRRHNDSLLYVLSMKDIMQNEINAIEEDTSSENDESNIIDDIRNEHHTNHNPSNLMDDHYNQEIPVISIYNSTDVKSKSSEGNSNKFNTNTSTTNQRMKNGQLFEVHAERKKWLPCCCLL